MPDMERFGHIQMLTNLLSTMPPQVDQQGNPLQGRVPFPRGKAAQWAVELVTVYGVRVHPDLATDKTLPSGAASGPRRIDDVVVTAEGLIQMLRDVPDVPSLTVLADRLSSALGDPVKEAAEMEAIRRENPDIIKSARVLQARLEAENAKKAAAESEGAQ